MSIVISGTFLATRARSSVCPFGSMTLTAMPLTPWLTQASMIGFWTSAAIRSGWRNSSSTSWSWAAFLAPASHRSQNGSVVLVMRRRLPPAEGEKPEAEGE